MLTFKCDAAFEQGVKDLADHEGVPVSAVIRQALREYVRDKVISSNDTSKNYVFIAQTLYDAVESGDQEHIKVICDSLSISEKDGVMPEIEKSIERSKHYRSETDKYIDVGTRLVKEGAEKASA